jgi:two-component system chemotaxis sensor kinase CheA
MSELEAYRALFVAESRENHENLVKNLLALEKYGSDNEAIGEIFRSAHTIKGTSASMGFANLERLCHTMEDIFQIIRSGSEEFASDLGDLLLGGSDLIEQMLDDVEIGGDSSSIDAEGLLNDLILWLNEHRGNPEKAQIVSQQPSIPLVSPDLPLNAVEYDIRPGFAIRITVADECTMKDVRALLTLNNLESLGTVISSDPTKEALDEGRFEGVLQLTIASDAGEEALKTAALGVDIATVEISSAAGPSLQSSAELVTPAGTIGNVRIPDSCRQQPAQEKNREIKNLRVEIGQLDRTMNLIEELVIDHGRLKQIAKNFKSKELDETIGMVGRSVTALQDLIMTIRMVPLNHIFNRLPRVVRDVAQYDGKEIEFVMEGGETELDRSVMDGLNDPLLHLIRNAVNHGIESPDVRERSGKTRKGFVSLSAHQDRDNVVIELVDDGAGINVERVKAKAIERGIISKEVAETLSKDDAIDLLFQPGFSTADKVTDISGRGVGLDVVKRAIEGLKGTVRVETTQGEGSRFELVLPPTMAIVDAMIVRINGRRIAIPTSSIVEVTNFKSDARHFIGVKEMIVHREEILQFYPLTKMYGSFKSGNLMIIVQYQKRKCCIPIDTVEGQQEVVVKPTNSFFTGDIRGISGATILGDGDVVPVFDVNSMM